jgi:phosphoserine/homoserine phosphotransferase
MSRSVNRHSALAKAVSQADHGVARLIRIKAHDRSIWFTISPAHIPPPYRRRFKHPEIALQIVCLDLEGVLTPEVWIEFSNRTGIPELARTTRDEPDYDKLMRGRIEILGRRNLGLPDIQKVIEGMKPLDGAREFLDWLRGYCQTVILSDTYYQFAAPLMRQLGYPTLFCHELVVDESGRVRDYRLRLRDQKRASVLAFRELGFYTIAAGDSYNDTTMLAAAHAGILFRPPANVTAEFPQFPSTQTYEELRAEIVKASAKD